MSSPWSRLRRNPSALCGFLLLAAIVLTALFAPLIAPADPWDLVGASFEPPFQQQYWLGTDALGRDVFSGVVHGARVSLFLGVVATAAALSIGLLVGAVVGYFGGLADDLLMRVTEVFQVVPSFVFAIVLVAVFTPSIGPIVAAIAMISWPPVARLVRAEFLSLRRREFVLAASVIGQPWHTIIIRQILPNALSPILVTSTMTVATAILLESALSFLGLGDPDLFSWGYMIGAGRNVIRQAWWITTFPGLALVMVVLGLNLVSEALNDALNPKLAGGGR